MSSSLRRSASCSNAAVDGRQQAEHGWGAQIVAGDRQHGGELRGQVGPQPVEQAGLVAGSALVVPGDRAQLAGQGAVRNQGLEPGVAVQREEAGDAASSVSSFLRAGPRAVGRSGQG